MKESFSLSMNLPQKVAQMGQAKMAFRRTRLHLKITCIRTNQEENVDEAQE
jgi:hypothetical protein